MIQEKYGGIFTTGGVSGGEEERSGKQVHGSEMKKGVEGVWYSILGVGSV